jgi:SAM-dependent methyltransferase
MGQGEAYYKSKEYREEVDESADPEAYFRLHDGEQAVNLSMIGSGSFRGKVIADVGCGGGSFLDGVRGYAAKAVAIEPSEAFRASLVLRGYPCYAYATDAARDFKAKMDLVTSFSVIEHVEDPLTFMKDIRALLAPGGRAFISTPNAKDALLEALPEDYPRFFYRKAHLWYFEAESLRCLAERAGFASVKVIPHHRFGLSNFIRWSRERAPKGHAGFDFVTPQMDAAWKAGLEASFRCDYLYAEFRVADSDGR